MIGQSFNNDLHPLTTPIKCVPLRACGPEWKRKMSAAITGLIRTGNPEYFDTVLNDARNKNEPERQNQARSSVAAINNYVDAVIRTIERQGGDTYDAIGAGVEIGFQLEENGMLPHPSEITGLINNTQAMETLGIHKPWTEYLETEQEFEDRKKKHEYDKQERARNDAAAGRNKVNITMPLQRRQLVHNSEMKITTEAPAGFERFFSGGAIDAPKSLEALNTEIIAFTKENATANTKAERAISGAVAQPKT